MATKHIYIAVGLLAAVLIGSLAFAGYLYTVKAGAKLQQLIEDNDAIRKDNAAIREQASRDREESDRRERVRNQELSIYMAAISAAKSTPVNEDQLARLVAQRLGEGFKVQVDMPKTEQGKPPLPDAPSTVTITGLNAAEKYRNSLLDCAKAEYERDSCKEGLVNKDNAIVAVTAERDTFANDAKTYKRERDAAVKVAKGGSWFSRLRSNAKWLVIGGAIGAGAVAASR